VLVGHRSGHQRDCMVVLCVQIMADGQETELTAPKKPDESRVGDRVTVSLPVWGQSRESLTRPAVVKRFLHLFLPL